MITICKYYIKPRKDLNELCPADSLVKAKSQVYLCASWGHFILKMQRGTTRQSKQKICVHLDHPSSKKWSFLCVQTNWVVHQELRNFVKITLTRVESFCEKRDWTRVESPVFSTWRESSPSHQKTWLESSHWLQSRYHRYLVVQRNIFTFEALRKKHVRVSQ